jgi:hypothetical protein
MSSTGNGRFVSGKFMSPATDIETASNLLGRLEAIEGQRGGVSSRDARTAIARRLQTLPGTLENLRRLRLKAVPSWLMARIRAELILSLQHQARQLEHEINLHLQSGAHHRDADLAEAQARLAQARALLLSK